MVDFFRGLPDDFSDPHVITAWGTVAYTLVTAVIAVFAWYAWRSSRSQVGAMRLQVLKAQQQLDEMKAMRVQSARPHLIIKAFEASFIPELERFGFGMLELDNVGAGPAIDVQVTVWCESSTGSLVGEALVLIRGIDQLKDATQGTPGIPQSTRGIGVGRSHRFTVPVLIERGSAVYTKTIVSYRGLADPEDTAAPFCFIEERFFYT